MKSWANIFRGIILIMGIIVIAFNAQLYILCKQQKNGIDAISDRQKLEAQVNGNKFQYQQDQIEHLSKDLEDARQQIKNQNDALVDIQAQADAIKQEVKGWQKDYVSILAQLEKKMDDSRENIKSLKVEIEKKIDVSNSSPDNK